jgi:hypothetical protein
LNKEISNQEISESIHLNNEETNNNRTTDQTEMNKEEIITEVENINVGINSFFLFLLKL